jgi:hypothetical protein
MKPLSKWFLAHNQAPAMSAVDFDPHNKGLYAQ